MSIANNSDLLEELLNTTDRWHFPLFMVGEFSQDRAGSFHFIAEWANCGPLTCLAATLRGDGAAPISLPPTTSATSISVGVPLLWASQATPPPVDSTPSPPYVCAAPGDFLHLGRLIVGDTAVGITEIPGPVQAICKPLLDAAFRHELSPVLHLPELGCSLVSLKARLPDEFARGKTRSIEIIVAYKDHDVLVSCLAALKFRMLQIQKALVKEAQRTARDDRAKYSESELAKFSSMHSNELRPLANLIPRIHLETEVIPFDQFLYRHGRRILLSVPLGQSQARRIVVRATQLRPQLIHLASIPSVGCSALQPVLKLPSSPLHTHVVSPPLTQMSITPRTTSTGKVSARGVFPEMPPDLSLIDSSSKERKCSEMERHGDAKHTLAGWLCSSFQKFQESYFDAVLWPLTLLLVNDGETSAASIHVKLEEGATAEECTLFQRAAETVFGRISWAAPPCGTSVTGCKIGSCKADASESTNTIFLHGPSASDASAPFGFRRSSAAASYGTKDLPSCSFALLMAARCRIAHMDTHALRTANESLKCDVEAARCASTNYVVAILAKRVYLRTANNECGPSKRRGSVAEAGPTPNKPLKLYERLKRSIFKKDDRRQEIEIREGLISAAQQKLRTSTLASVLSAFTSELDSGVFSRGGSGTSVQHLPEYQRHSLSREGLSSCDDTIGGTLDPSYKAAIEDDLPPDLVALLKAGIAVSEEGPAIRIEHKICFSIARHLRRVALDANLE